MWSNKTHSADYLRSRLIVNACGFSNNIEPERVTVFSVVFVSGDLNRSINCTVK